MNYWINKIFKRSYQGLVNQIRELFSVHMFISEYRKSENQRTSSILIWFFNDGCCFQWFGFLFFNQASAVSKSPIGMAIKGH